MSSEKEAHLSNPFSKYCNQLLHERWNTEICETLRLMSVLLLCWWEPFLAEVAKSHTYGEGKKQKNIAKSEQFFDF